VMGGLSLPWRDAPARVSERQHWWRAEVLFSPCGRLAGGFWWWGAGRGVRLTGVLDVWIAFL